MSLNIAFAGTPEFAVPALEALARSGHSLVGVLTQPDRPSGRGRALAASAVKQCAQRMNLPVAQPERLSTAGQRAPLMDWAPDLLVVVAYGLILPPAALELPRLGCLNIHASLLPRWRGAAPIQRAILAGDERTGVSLMRLAAGLDTGPVYEQRELAIGEHETAGELQQRLSVLGAELLLHTVSQLESGRAQALPQPDHGVSYAGKLSKAEARLDWRRSAVELARQVRAFNPWPVAETISPGGRLRVWRARVLPAASGTAGAPGTVLGLRDTTIAVACGNGMLGLEQVQAEGRRAVAAAEFWHAAPLTGQVLT